MPPPRHPHGIERSSSKPLLNNPFMFRTVKVIRQQQEQQGTYSAGLI
jgi:hypothetical protein